MRKPVIYFVIDGRRFGMMAPTKATWAAGKMFNAAEGGVWRHDIIGAAEYRRRWLLGKYSTSPKVAFGATKLWELLKSRRSDARNCMGTNQGGDGYFKKYSTLPKTVLIYSWRRRRPAGAVLKNSSIRKKRFSHLVGRPTDDHF